MSIIESMRGRNTVNEARRQVALPPLPVSEDDPEVKAFLHNAKLIREERNMYRDQCAHLSNELRLAQERLRSQTAELADVKSERDYYQNYSSGVRKSFTIIKRMIEQEEAEAENFTLTKPSNATPDQLAKLEAAITQEAAKE